MKKGMVCNESGIVLSFLALVLLMNLIAVNNLLHDDAGFQEMFSKISALSTSGSKISNLDNSAILYGRDNNEPARQRILPFDFTADANTITFSQLLPQKQSVVDVFYDSVNSLGVLAESSSAYDGIAVDVNAASNQKWGGDSHEIKLSILPQCFSYSLRDTNYIGVGKGCGTFDFNSIKKIDLNVVVSDAEDFNSVSCVFGASSSCPSDSFNPLNATTYFRLEILDSNCGNCAIPQSSRTVSGYFSPSLSNSITISCISGGGICTSQPIQITLSDSLAISHPETANEFMVGLDFNSEVEYVRFDDFNATATSLVYGAAVRNR